MPDEAFPDSKVRGANMGPIWGRQDPGGAHVGSMNLAISIGSLRSKAISKYSIELVNADHAKLLTWRLKS